MNDSDEDDNAVAEILPPEVWDAIPEEARPVLEKAISAQFEMIRSPLLPPEILKEYGKVVPGLEKKLVEWVESETNHRHKLEQAAFQEAKDLRSKAQLSGPIIAGASIFAASAIAIFSPYAASTVVACVVVIAGVGGPFAARLLASKWSGQTGETNE